MLILPAECNRWSHKKLCNTLQSLRVWTCKLIYVTFSATVFQQLDFTRRTLFNHNCTISATNCVGIQPQIMFTCIGFAGLHSHILQHVAQLCYCCLHLLGGRKINCESNRRKFEAKVWRRFGKISEILKTFGEFLNKIWAKFVRYFWRIERNLEKIIRKEICK